MTTPTSDRFAHLHVQSHYSLRRGSSSPEALVSRALEHGQPALAITDHLSIAGHVPAQLAARGSGLNLILGAELPLLLEANGTLETRGEIVLLAEHRDGYANLNRLITLALERDPPGVTLEALALHHDGLILLTGGRGGPLRQFQLSGQPQSALELARALEGLFGARMYVELVHGRLEGDTGANRALARLARLAGLKVVLTNDVRHAAPDDWALCDALNLSRLGLTMEDDSLLRPWNDSAHVASRAELETRLPYGAALDATLEIAARCRVNLLAPKFSAPIARVPVGETPASRLEALVRAGIRRRYPPSQHRAAVTLMERELETIRQMRLEHYFLAVHEVIQAARDLGIRTSGRGSAAASIVVFALGIAHADPLRFRLSFERFLNPERMSTEPPDIDIDVQSSRRDELIAWVVNRFGADCTAMAANHNLYGLRPAIRDLGKVLGYSLPVVDRLAKAVSRQGSPRHVALFRSKLEAVAGASPLLEVLIALVSRVNGVPRDLSLHSGGMLLSPEALDFYSARFTSTGGTWQAMLNKDTAEAAGLIKLDLLGLRILDVVQMSLELLEGQGIAVDLDALTYDDELVYDAICDGDVLMLFQIESPAQAHLGAQLQPRDFATLVAQIALNRPGAIQAGSVNPYVRRYRGEEAISVIHPSLELPLEETLGVIVYQDQVIDVAMSVCGWSGGIADAFRKALSKVRDDEDLEVLRERFVTAALETHSSMTEAVAGHVFSMLASYRGYGFPRAHSTAFGVIAYHTAYLKSYFPKEYFCAVLEHEPGMYNAQTVRGEAERHGIRVRPVALEQSGTQYGLEREDTPEGERLFIRSPFTAVGQLTKAIAELIVTERERAPFQSLEDCYRRCAVPADALEGLARAGAFDAFLPRLEALWAIGVLETRLGASGGGETPLLDAPAFTENDLATLARLGVLDRIRWDVEVAGSSATHPVAPLRGQLETLGAVTVSSLADRRGAVTVTGLRGMIQCPETALGTRFILIEDETGLIQCIVPRDAWDRLEAAFSGGLVAVRGAVLRVGKWRALAVGQATCLDGALEFAGVALPKVMGLN